MMNRVQRLPDWLRFRSRPAAVVTALVTCLLLAPWGAEAQGNSAPVFTEGASATRSFHETIGDVAVETGSNIGMPVAATDIGRQRHADLHPGGHGRGQVRYQFDQWPAADPGGGEI